MNRLASLMNELVTNCHQLKLIAFDGKRRLTDVATTEELLRIIQAIPSEEATELNHLITGMIEKSAEIE